MMNQCARVISALSVFLTAATSFAGEPLEADTPVTTARGNTFVAPAEWTVTQDGPATIVSAPEGGSQIVIVDVEADDAESAIEAGWAAYKPLAWDVRTANPSADADGWSQQLSINC